jgi:hypothetical protein
MSLCLNSSKNFREFVSLFLPSSKISISMSALTPFSNCLRRSEDPNFLHLSHISSTVFRSLISFFLFLHSFVCKLEARSIVPLSPCLPYTTPTLRAPVCVASVSTLCSGVCAPRVATTLLFCSSGRSMASPIPSLSGSP